MKNKTYNMEFCDVCKQKVNCMNNFHFTREEVDKLCSHNMIKYYFGLLFKNKIKIKVCEHCTQLFKISNNSEYHVLCLAKRFMEKATKNG